MLRSIVGLAVALAGWPLGLAALLASAGPLPAVETRPATSAILYDAVAPVTAEARTAYGAAMRIYREAMTRPPGWPKFLDWDARRMPWTWVSEDGHSVQRRADGSFLISTADGNRLWFTERACRVETWPQLACADGERPRAAAPELETLLVDEVVFRRSLPDAPSELVQ